MVNPDIASTNEDEAVTIAVLANDEAGLTLSAITSGPGTGQARISGSSIVFAPSRNATGTETMGYRACKSSNLCSETTVAIRINPVNDAPVATPDTATTNWGESVAVSVLANDIDVDGDALRVTDVDLAGPGTATTNGTTVTYTAPIDFAGSVVIDYTACDPTGSCSSATVAVTVVAVARPPVAKNDTATTNGQSGKVKKVNVLANDTDPDGDLDSSTLSISQQPVHGKATLNQGLIDYEADAGFQGTDSFTYRICDATGLCDTAVVRVTVP
ncbi:MAG: Ig-like domain-containing protein [Acidimicrobiia bacterium]